MNRRTPFLLVSILALAALLPTLRAPALGLGTPNGSTADERWAVSDVSIVDVENGVLLPHRTVLISGEKIEMIAPAGEAAIPGGTREVSGEGLYLLPGLFDSHVHYIDPNTFGRLFVANGVTCVRDMGGFTEGILQTRDALAAKEMIGPEMKATGAIIDGTPPIWPFSEACETAEDGRAAVKKLAERGVDQIKVYSRLKSEPYRAIVDEAHQRGLKVVGHIPWEVSLEDALEIGQDSSEHLDGWGGVIARLAGKGSPEEGANSFQERLRAWRHYPEIDRPTLRKFLAEVRESGMHFCPTIIVIDRIGRMGDPELKEDPLIGFVPDSLKSFWEGGRYQGISSLKHRVLAMQDLVKEMHLAGIPILCGTDLGNPYLVAGFSLHEEMRLLQEGGLPPAAVLRAATIVPARFLGVDDRLGSVAEGKTASFLLCRRDPLQDVRAASEIAGVSQRGRYYDRAALDGLLAEVRESVKATAPTEGVEVDLSLPGEVLHRGRYAYEFQGRDGGQEDFVITETEDGYHIKARSQPRGGMMAPSVITYHTDRNFGFRSAEWRLMGENRIEANYSIEGKTLRAAATRNGQELPAQTIDLDEDSVVVGPAYALVFVSLRAFPLKVGESKEYSTVAFGWPSWRCTVSRSTLRRHEDTTITHGGEEIPARYYTQRGETPMGVFESELWAGADGRLIRAKVRMAFGTIEVRLAEPESSEGQGGAEASPREDPDEKQSKKKGKVY